MDKRKADKTVRPPEPPVHAEPPPMHGTVGVSDAVQATVTRDTAPASPGIREAVEKAATAPPRKVVFMCFGDPGITREIRAEEVALNGAPFCTQCGIRMVEDITGKL